MNGKCFVLLLSAFLSAGAAPVGWVRIMLPPQANSSMRNTARILERQVAQRCGAKVTPSGASALTLEFSLEPGFGAEGFSIADGPSGTIRIIGNDERGLLYGAGKLLRTHREKHQGP